jgi:predicted double-glycine peptidase
LLGAISALLASAILLGGTTSSAESDAGEVPAPDAIARIQTSTGVAVSGLQGSGGSGGAAYDVPTRSWSEFKWQNVVRQRTDIGCGAAALATILTYYFDFPTDEREMVEALYYEAVQDYKDPKHPPPGDIRQIGFNLRHIRAVARKGGLVAAGFEVDAENLEEVKIPVITRVTVKGFDHFAVFRGAVGGRVYLADPAFGNISYRLDQFERIWSGVMMGFVRRGEVLPENHDLLVRLDRDERQISWKNVMRLATQEPAPHRFDLGPTGVQASTYDAVRIKLAGLESVFPTYKSGSMSFGEDISY